MFQNTPVKGALREGFQFWSNGFANDERACFLRGQELRGACPHSFRFPGYAFMTDSQHVYSWKGPIKEADAETFEACDDRPKPD